MYTWTNLRESVKTNIGFPCVASDTPRVASVRAENDLSIVLKETMI